VFSVEKEAAHNYGAPGKNTMSNHYIAVNEFQLSDKLISKDVTIP